MDRDLASQLVTTMGSIKTALETIATNTTPASLSLSDSRSGDVPEAPAEEPAPEEPKTTRSTKK